MSKCGSNSGSRSSSSQGGSGKGGGSAEGGVAKGMAVDGPVEKGIYLVDGEAMHQLVAGKSKLGASNSVDWDLLQFALMDSYCFFAAVAVNYFKH